MRPCRSPFGCRARRIRGPDGVAPADLTPDPRRALSCHTGLRSNEKPGAEEGVAVGLAWPAPAGAPNGQVTDGLAGASIALVDWRTGKAAGGSPDCIGRRFGTSDRSAAECPRPAKSLSDGRAMWPVRRNIGDPWMGEVRRPSQSWFPALPGFRFSTNAGPSSGERAAFPYLRARVPPKPCGRQLLGCCLPQTCRARGAGSNYGAAQNVSARQLSLPSVAAAGAAGAQRDGHSGHQRIGKSLRQRRSHVTTPTGFPVARPQSHTDRFQRQMCPLGGLDEFEAARSRLFVS